MPPHKVENNPPVKPKDDSKKGSELPAMDQAGLSHVLVIGGIAHRIADLLQGERFGDDIADDF